MNEIWEALTPIVTAHARARVVKFCEDKNIDFGDLSDLGTRTNGNELAFGIPDEHGQITGIKYRNIATGARRCEPGSTFPWPLVVGNPRAMEWFVVEGETDAARLLGLTENAALLVLPSGAGMFKREWAGMVPRAATVYLAYDNDQAGEQGAAKAHRFLAGAMRLRPPVKDWCDWPGNPMEFQGLVEDASGETETPLVTMFDAMCDFEEEMRNPPDFTKSGVPTPFSFLDRLYPGRVYVLAGYTKDGKTALSTQFLEAAASDKKRVAFFSIEMTWRDLRDRIITTYGVPAKMVERRRFSEQYQNRVNQALAAMALWQVDIIDDPAIDLDGIQQILMGADYDYAIIDHLHRFGFDDRRDLEKIMRGIVNLSQQFEIPILLLAQLKRPYNTDKAPRPTLSMLRESGMIEAEAAMVSFIYRKRDEHGLRTTESELIVAANRYGHEDLKPLFFDADSVRFTEVSYA